MEGRCVQREPCRPHFFSVITGALLVDSTRVLSLYSSQIRSNRSDIRGIPALGNIARSGCEHSIPHDSSMVFLGHDATVTFSWNN